MMRVVVAPNVHVEMLHFTVSYEFLQIVGRRRILGTLREVGGADNYPILHPLQ
jgi:hypothetical protein